MHLTPHGSSIFRRSLDRDEMDVRAKVAVLVLAGIVLALAAMWLSPPVRLWLRGDRGQVDAATVARGESCLAWHVDSPAVVLKRSNMHFLREARVQARFAIPTDRDFYFEIMPLMVQPGATVLIGAGDVMYDLLRGAIRAGGVTLDRIPSPASPEGSIIGCHVTPWPKPSVTFSRDGHFSHRIRLPPATPLHPTIAASARCSFSTNFGYREFLYPPSLPPPRYSIAAPPHALLR